ncbi:aldo/keto reductase family protein [Jeotgalibaca sp. MA1X17-3]|uniref:aldo/keto reductase family protein n=1 Tax=Jeotgalibaca sp. MA1X17-3 TaxID=2908211 RepID=UPI001F172123|nr:aldo/keto reductase family protein [Jeotgalibaca sp. MA1X17-3]UJF15570.1 aldo/keto reductase family protein [Jeotgalibaca sp. MA1X17-3]
MNYRNLGNSGLRVSELSLGSWLTYGKSVEDDTAKKCIETAYDLGINFFDTANVYESGNAEIVLGNVLKNYDRSSVVVASKVFFPMGDGPNDRGLSRKHIFEQCDASLQRLEMDYLDLYQCHRYDPSVPIEETLWALDDLQRQGKILYAGVSEWPADKIQEAHRIAKERNFRPLVSNQPVYNMIERYIEMEVLPVSVANGMGQIVFSPLAQGILTGKYKPGQQVPADSRAANTEISGFMKSYLENDYLLEVVQQLQQFAHELDINLPQLALAWILRQPGVSSAIIGASRPEQIEDNVKAVDVELTDQILQGINELLMPISNFGPRK